MGRQGQGRPVGSAIKVSLNMINQFLFFPSSKLIIVGIHTELREAKLSKRNVLETEFQEYLYNIQKHLKVLVFLWRKIICVLHFQNQSHHSVLMGLFISMLT